MIRKWNDNEVDYLRRWWGTASARMIADTLGRTRSSVIGFAHRLGLPDLGNPKGGGWHQNRGAPKPREPYQRRDDNGKLKTTGVRAAKERAPGTIAGSQTWSLKSRQQTPEHRHGIRAAEAQRQRDLRSEIRNAQNCSTTRRLAREPEAPRACEKNPFAAVAQRTAPPLIPPTPAVPDDGRRGVPFADLRADGCKWAVTPHHVRVRDIRFCNEPREAGRSYCACHCNRARGNSTQKIDGIAGLNG